MFGLDSVVQDVVSHRVSKRMELFGFLWSPVIEVWILCLICLLSFFIRLFAVIRFESVIHEFDPWFNYRTTQYLTEKGFYEFWNWFDDVSWYPLGRVVGQTLYPGLMSTSALFYYVLNFFGICVNIRNMCVFMGPIFSCFTSLAAYALTREVWSREAGLFAALFMGTCPSYLSRSVAGSYDNEAVAIFALVFSFYTFVRAVNSGRLLWSLGASLAYFYMVSTWGGYVFVVNTVAIFVLALLLLDRFTAKHYVVFASYYVFGTLFCLNIPFVGFGAVSSSEHMGSHGIFLVTSALMLARFLSSQLEGLGLSPKPSRSFVGVFVGVAALSFLAVFAALSYSGRTAWSGRSMTLLDPTYASKFIPIIASVSEHQPTSWNNYVMDLYVLPLFVPVGLFACFRRLSDGALFLGVYGVLGAYFSGVMIRLLLVLAPAACCLAGVGVSSIVAALVPVLKRGTANVSHPDVTPEPTPEVSREPTPTGSPAGSPLPSPTAGGSGKKLGVAASAASAASATTAAATAASAARTAGTAGTAGTASAGTAPVGRSSVRPLASSSVSGRAAGTFASLLVLLGVSFVLVKYVNHATSMSSAAYSSPSIVMSGRARDGSRVIQDDFREAYYWLRMNTPPSAKILSWWDYGYQITGMSNRTVLVDNNTWNNTHIATVGLILASSEQDAYPLLRKLDVDYVLVLYGGVARYNSDDINKFLWPIRIASGVYPDLVQESQFIGKHGYTIDASATEKMKNSVLYKLSYYRAGELTNGRDLVRGQQIAQTLKPTHFQEAFTSENSIVRIYKVNPPPNRG